MNLNDLALKIDKLNVNVDDGVKVMRALVRQKQIANLLAFASSDEIDPTVANRCADLALEMMKKESIFDADTPTLGDYPTSPVK